MCEPFVTRQISIRQSNSVQTDLSISSSTLATAAVMMRCFSSFKLTGSGGTKTLSCTLLRKLCVHYANGFDNYIMLKVSTRGAKKCIHILIDVIYVLLFQAEQNYGSNVQQGVRSKDGFNQMNASVTMRHYNFLQFFSFLKCVYIFWHPLYIFFRKSCFL